MLDRVKYKHDWYLKNRTRILANRKEYRLGNLDKIQRAGRRYYISKKTDAQYKAKRRNERYMRRFGITTDEYEEMLIEQNGVCAICLNAPKKFRLAVDHDHKTGKIRGLLCYRCNYGLGWLGDNWEKIQRVYSYFKAHYDRSGG